MSERSEAGNAGLRSPEAALAELVGGRHSTRRFSDKEVPDETLGHLLALARKAPSGANLQPGEFIRIEGDARERVSTRLVQAFREGAQEPEDYRYFPQPMPHGLRRRQIEAAQALYGRLQIARDDRAGRDALFERNFRFFDAPVALLVTIDARMGSGCYMDLGMCLYGLMLAAAAHGLGTCAIGALASYPELIRSSLGLAADRHIVCGIAIGYADPDAPENAVRTTRRDTADFLSVIR